MWLRHVIRIWFKTPNLMFPPGAAVRRHPHYPWHTKLPYYPRPTGYIRPRAQTVPYTILSYPIPLKLMSCQDYTAQTPSFFLTVVFIYAFFRDVFINFAFISLSLSLFQLSLLFLPSSPYFHLHWIVSASSLLFPLAVTLIQSGCTFTS